MDVCGFGSINLDYVVRAPTRNAYFDSLEDGDEQEVSDFDLLARRLAGLDEPECHIGGSAVNAIRALGRLDPDLNLSIVAPLARHLPRAVDLEELAGIDTTGVVYHDGPPSTCVSVVNGRDRKLRSYNNPDGVCDLLFRNCSQTIEALCRAKVIHVSSFLTQGAGLRVAEILEEVRERSAHEIRICLDLGLPWARDHEIAEKLLPLADVLFVSDDELRELLPEVDPHSRSEEIDAVTELQTKFQCGPETITILKRRARPTDQVSEAELRLHRPRVGGVMYERDAETEELNRYELLRDGLDQEQITDSTGAGDFFASAILATMVSPRTRAIQTLGLATAMARHKFGHTAKTAYRDVERVPRGDNVAPQNGKIFISHAHDDAELVGKLLNLFGPGIYEGRDDFFCTSQARTAIPKGLHLNDEVIANLRLARYVMFIVTPSFLDSKACIQELGGAQVLRLPTIPLLRPGSDFEQFKLPIMAHIGVRLDEEDKLAELQDEFATMFDWPYRPVGEWKTAMKELRSSLKGDDSSA